MSKSELSRVRKAWPWLIVLVLVLAGTAYLILSHIGSSVSSSAVIELEKDLISTNGLMIAFTGIIFTGMLAEIRFRTERAIQASDQQRANRLERTSNAPKDCSSELSVLRTIPVRCNWESARSAILTIVNLLPGNHLCPSCSVDGRRSDQSNDCAHNDSFGVKTKTTFERSLS